MDNTKTTHISLFSGYGGLDLGLKGAIPNLKTICYVERELFAISVLVKAMSEKRLDTAPIWTDACNFPAGQFKGVDIISGGFPCQPFSAAGKQRYNKDERFLLGSVLQIVAAARPVYVFLENVEGFLSVPQGNGGWDYLYPRLRYLGYKVEAGLFSASEVGAPQRRNRIFILGKSMRQQREREHTKGINKKRQKNPDGQFEQPSFLWPVGRDSEQHDWEPPRIVAHSKCGDGDSRQVRGWERGTRTSASASKTVQNGRDIKSSMGGDTDGPPDRMVQSTSQIDELRLLGNGVVPAQATKAFITLMERL